MDAFSIQSDVKNLLIKFRFHRHFKNYTTIDLKQCQRVCSGSIIYITLTNGLILPSFLIEKLTFSKRELSRQAKQAARQCNYLP